MATPMQEQYQALKSQYPDCILFFRMGDFYECFDDDALVMSKVLGIALTSRSKEEDRPMAGIPYHALGSYLHKMTTAGHKVAIAEQTEDPKKAKGLVKREVIKVVTPGTVFDEKSLQSGENNYIAAISRSKKKNEEAYGLAVCDITTGEVWIQEFWHNEEEILDELHRLAVQELLLPSTIDLAPLPPVYIQDCEELTVKQAEKVIIDAFEIKSLSSFGISDYPLGVMAAGMLLEYLTQTQKQKLPHIKKVLYRSNQDYMLLDAATIRNLELVRGNNSKWSLLSVLDDCKTPMGKRKLIHWILKPLKGKKEIEKRQRVVSSFMKGSSKLKNLREHLDQVYDIERILGRLGNNSASPKDLIALKTSLEHAQEIKNLLFKVSGVGAITKVLKSIVKDVESVVSIIDSAIVKDPPYVITDGGIIRPGFDTSLDVIREKSEKGKTWLKDLQEAEIKRTGISSLKVKFNKVFGYYIEVSRANIDKVPDNYIRSQTLTNAERFVTEELKEAEDAILHANERSKEKEYKLYLEIRDKLITHILTLQTLADTLSTLDCLSTFAHIARDRGYVCPTITHSGEITLVESRHPVVEVLSHEPFVPNDVSLTKKDGRIHIITGPNMAGKSTFIRQVALLVLMAQIGSFIPAQEASIGIVDRIFTRVGAADNLTQGESTFMLEMNETANILHNATESSLIVLDEVGRGTSTYDGVAIAWSVVEYIAKKIGAKTLFATHYHELVGMSDYIDTIKNYNVAVEEQNDTVVFLRKIVKGGTDKSYGIHVAQLAGVPDTVIEKSKEILMSLEQEGMFTLKRVESELHEKKAPPEVIVQQSFLSRLPESAIEKKIKEIDINNLTPLEALKLLEKLREELHQKKK